MVKSCLCSFLMTLLLAHVQGEDMSTGGILVIAKIVKLMTWLRICGLTLACCGIWDKLSNLSRPLRVQISK